MLTAELIYDADCPNMKEARVQLLRAFAGSGLPARWLEWQRDAPESPPYVRSYGSPTILVDGRDVAGASPSDGADCCRLYASSNGKLNRAPSSEDIVSAFLRAKKMA